MKNIIYIQIDEDISSILQRIQHFKKTTFHLVLPKKSLLFESSINLGILKHRCEEKGNELILITSDRIGKNLAKNAGIKVQSKLLNAKSSAPSLKKEKKAAYPIQARRNEVKPETPHRTEKKFTIGQLIQTLREKKDENKESLSERFYSSMHYSRPIMLGLILCLSLSIFFLITYIALPAATVFIRPTFESLNHTVNITLADKARNPALLNQNQPNVITSQIIQSTAKETRVFHTTGKRFEGVNAKGSITIINSAREEWQLIAGTRFQTPEGLIFRSSSGVTVPSATMSAAGETVPGRLTIIVEADEFDPYNEPIGERGNIEPTTFTIPGLSTYNQKRIWAENTEPITGGVSQYSVVVLEADIEAAKKQLEENLTLIAKQELKSHLEQLNEAQKTHWALLNEDRYISTNLIQVRTPEGLEGSNKERFEVYAEVAVEGIAYDGQELLDFLTKELEKRAHPDMIVKKNSIDFNRIQYEWVDRNLGLQQMKESGQIRLTVTADGIQEYIIDSSLEAGLRFSERVKERVLSLPLDEAKAYLNNLPEVEEVEIKMWPVWLKKMPRLMEKIDVKLSE